MKTLLDDNLKKGALNNADLPPETTPLEEFVSNGPWEEEGYDAADTLSGQHIHGTRQVDERAILIKHDPDAEGTPYASAAVSLPPLVPG